jgi:Helicase conserved C-terminal domain
LLQTRFHRPQDALYLGLRESYLRTLLPLADWAREHLPRVLTEANGLLRGVRVGKTSAERLDYQLAKRCVEQAAAKLWRRERGARQAGTDAVARMLDKDFLSLGLDLTADEYEGDQPGDDRPNWEISERVATMVLGQEGSLWEQLTAPLDALETELRVRVVEQLARYLTYKQVPFLSELLAEAAAAGLSVDPVESTAILDFLPAFWRTPAGDRWLAQFEAFLSYFVQRDPQQKLDILDGPIKTGDFARHTKDGESRERLREAFNTPLYPMILVANEVMQEGLDLHKQCRRVVHHDLVWNPAHVEQRIGRIDRIRRLGSLTNRLRKNGDEVTLDVLYPVIRGTIDERLFRTVKRREKWLEFLLGAAPNFSEYSLTDEEPPPLPDRLGAELAIDLGPRVPYMTRSSSI